MLLPWTFFSQSLSYAVEAIVTNGDLIKKVAVPKMVFPMAALVSNLINLLLSLIPLALLVPICGTRSTGRGFICPCRCWRWPSSRLGMTFFFAAANVYYRDVSHILQMVLSAWFYVTPIIYPLDTIPAKYQWIFKLNPIIYVINGFRLAVYYGQLPKAPSILASFVCAFVSLFIGFSHIPQIPGNFVFYV